MMGGLTVPMNDLVVPILWYAVLAVVTAAGLYMRDEKTDLTGATFLGLFWPIVLVVLLPLIGLGWALNRLKGRGVGSANLDERLGSIEADLRELKEMITKLSRRYPPQ